MSEHRRPTFVLAAVGALAVTVLFATGGDGLDVGHTLTWGLLTIAFTAAAVRGNWTGFAIAVALIGVVCYLVVITTAVFVG